MLDNGSVTSLSSQGSGRMRDRTWRKPVPKYLADPSKRITPLSEAEMFRKVNELDLSYSELDHPPVSSTLSPQRFIAQCDAFTAPGELARNHRQCPKP